MSDAFIDKLLKQYYGFLPDLDYFIVANTTNPRMQDPSLANTNLEELFSKNEFAEIASAIFDAFGYVNVFYSEQSFIEFVLTYLKEYKENCFVFNFARNGTGEGKKSLIPAFCDLFKIKYSGSNALAISLLRNKFLCGTLLSALGVKTPEFFIYKNPNDILGMPNKLFGAKVIVKNISEAASKSITKENVFVLTKNSIQLLDHLRKVMNSDSLMVQQYIPGKECEVLVYQDKNTFHACEPIEIICQNSEFMDSAISNSYLYKFGLLSETCSKEIVMKIKLYAEKAAKLLNIKDYARFDFRTDGKEAYLFDIAGTPYSIKHSSIAYLFTQIYDYKYKDFFKSIAALSYHNYVSP